MKLKTRLRRLADQWCASHDRSLARLSTLVMNDGGFFERLRNPKAGVTDGTLEKFARFFANAEHWPGDDVPQEAIDFLHVLGISGDTAVLSSGTSEQISPVYLEVNSVAGEGSARLAAEGAACGTSAAPEGCEISEAAS